MVTDSRFSSSRAPTPWSHGRFRRFMFLGVLTSLLGLVAPLLAVATPGGSAAWADPATCQRDVAADVRWVSWLYHTFMGRDAGLPEAAAWLGPLTDGEPYAGIAASVASSSEASRVTAKDLAERFLHRSAGTDAELTGWSNMVAAAGPDLGAIAFLSSDEAYGRAGSTANGWVDALYHDVVGAMADAGGAAYWAGLLANGTPRAQVAAAMWLAPGPTQSRISTLYQQILGRRPDQGGLAYWASQAPVIGTRGVAAALAGSPPAWTASQALYRAPATAQPPQCPPASRWIPAAGSIIHDLKPIGDRGSKLVALTFDDGPDATWTPQVLDVLARKGVKATFFLVGFQVKAHPELVQRELAEGHHLGVHTMTHPDLRKLSAAAQTREIVDDLRLVEGYAGAGNVHCFRPPYGNHNATTDAIARDNGLASVLWSRDGRDWARPGTDYIVDQNLDTRYDGGRAVLLLHDAGTNRSQTVAALERLIDSLRAQGYKFVQIC